MPLLVHCPQGCKIRVPVSRAGRIVRCSECKSAIRIAQVDLSSLTSSELIPCSAKLAKRKSAASEDFDSDSADELLPEEVAHTTSQLQQPQVSMDDVAAARRESSQSYDPVEPQGPGASLPLPAPRPTDARPVGVSDNELADLDPDIQRVVKSPLRVPPVMHTKPWRQVQPLTTVTPDADMVAIDVEIRTDTKATVPERMKTKALSDLPAGLPKVASITSAPIIDLQPASETEPSLEPADWQQRLEEANADRRVLARILSFFLLLVAVVNMTPAIYHWSAWASVEQTVPLPRWIYLQIFVGAIYLVYSIFLFQIPDWSALRSVSVAMLAMAFGFGVVSTGLLVEREGAIAGVLGIPFSLNREAGIWCLAMLCLATVMSYWAGKESFQWRRAEDVLREIL